MLVVISLTDNDKFFYNRPQYRSGPYFIGLLLGIFYKKYTMDEKENNTKSSNLIYKLSKVSR